ncbi:MAG: hypothetical protein EBU31_05680 [Proteobacteria bacterium]|nr:hypothetical protein [Pseudomonadota bacterium]
MKAFVLFASVGVVSSVASAEVVPGVARFDSLKEWTTYAMDLSPAYSTVADSLTGFKPIVRPSLSGGSGWTSWTATAGSGIGVRGGTFTGSTSAETGVHGIGGNFGFRDEDGTFQPGSVLLTLSSGASIYQTFSSKSDFAGFWLTDPAVTITGMSLQPVSGSNLAAYTVSVDNLYFGGVPAPGALALLGVAGICTAKRRR